MYGLPRARVGVDRFAAVVLVSAAIYVGLAWSPSSYGEVLSQMGVPGEGLVLGQPRAIRSDEWALWTPLIQASVNNEFARFNETSVYREDLRNFNGLPLADGALVFKPYLWPFFFLPPAYAYSFYHAFWIALFLLGYARLLHALALPRSHAILATLTLFFTGFVQTWWTTLGPVLAGFPWLLLIATSSLRVLPKALLTAYVTAAWLLAHLYPPTLITLAFVAGVVLLAFSPARLRVAHAAACGAGALLGALGVAFYLREVIPAVADTVFPGGRVSAGAVGASPIQWGAQFFPFLVTSGFRPLVSWNVCEASTVGTWIPLLTLAFVDHGELRRRLFAGDEVDRHLRRQVTVLTLGIVLTSLWILAPLPAFAGWPLLWHRVPANRMWFACGLLVLLVSLRILSAVTPRVTWPRAGAVAVTALAAWWASERALAPAGHLPRYDELLLLAPLGMVLALRAKLGRALPTALVGCAALANLAVFGGFNPVQSAVPIFERPATAVSERLDRLARSHPRGWLVIDGAYGAWLNGWGYRSVTHALLAPHTSFFRPLFPGLPLDRFQHLFNRTAMVNLTPAPHPYLSGDDLLWLPLEAFDAPRIPVALEPLRAQPLEKHGILSPRKLFRMGDGGVIVYRGWAAMDWTKPGAHLRIQSDLPLQSARAYPSLGPTSETRPAEAKGHLSGFALALTGEASIARPDNEGRVRVISTDPQRGNFEITPGGGSWTPE